MPPKKNSFSESQKQKNCFFAGNQSSEKAVSVAIFNDEIALLKQIELDFFKKIAIVTDEYAHLIKIENALLELLEKIEQKGKEQKLPARVIGRAMQIREGIMFVLDECQEKLSNLLEPCRLYLQQAFQVWLDKHPDIMILHDLIVKVSKKYLNEESIPCVYLCGGIIRNALLNIDDYNDIDFKTNANIAGFIDEFCQAKLRNLGVSPVVTFKWKRNENSLSQLVDVSQLIQGQTLVDVMNDCDATINGLFFRPKEGLIISDDAIKDILKRQLTIPDLTQIANNPDRIFRIFHYSTHIGLAIEKNTSNAIGQIAQDIIAGKKTLNLPKRRVSFEINKSFIHGKAEMHFNKLYAHHFIQVIFPLLADFLNSNEAANSIRENIRDLDRNLQTGDGINKPEDFYFGLLMPYIQHILKQDTGTDRLKLCDTVATQLQERVALFPESMVALKQKLYECFVFKSDEVDTVTDYYAFPVKR